MTGIRSFYLNIVTGEMIIRYSYRMVLGRPYDDPGNNGQATLRTDNRDHPW